MAAAPDVGAAPEHPRGAAVALVGRPHSRDKPEAPPGSDGQEAQAVEAGGAGAGAWLVVLQAVMVAADEDGGAG